ncbi:MAG: hypothetical protein JWO50_354 [Candidatus Kaiserbacteria bacterium]|nr:hypothetical protein [Candidatus Kaiserbacteria bacterium]
MELDMINIINCVRNWRVPASSDELLASCDAIITHEFGDQKTPSQSTIAIVRDAVELCRKYDKPLITQFPGNIVAEELGLTPFAVINSHAVTGKYLDTEEVNRQVAEICGAYGWKRVIVCTHPHHIWRAGNNLQTFGLEAIYPRNAHIPYDSDCSRRMVWSAWLFVPYEICARALYMRMGHL